MLDRRLIQFLISIAACLLVASAFGPRRAVVKVHELGDSSVNFVVRPWAAREDYWDVYWDVTREVKLRFDREGISIPFPQRDVHVHPANGGQAVAASDAGITGSGGA